MEGIISHSSMNTDKYDAFTVGIFVHNFSQRIRHQLLDMGLEQEMIPEAVQDLLVQE